MSTKWKRGLLLLLALTLIGAAAAADNFFVMGMLVTFSILEAYHLGAIDTIVEAKKRFSKDGAD